MRVNVSTLTGEALDWAVATCEDRNIMRDPMGFKSGSESGYWIWEEKTNNHIDTAQLIGRNYSPSKNWLQGGEIIERENVSLASPSPVSDHWTAMTNMSTHKQHGDTALIAAMRCYVETKMGGEIDIPNSLNIPNEDAA